MKIVQRVFFFFCRFRFNVKFGRIFYFHSFVIFIRKFFGFVCCLFIFQFFFHFDTNFDCWIVDFYVNFPFRFRSFSVFPSFFLKMKMLCALCFIMRSAKRIAKKNNLNMKSNTEYRILNEDNSSNIFVQYWRTENIYIFTCIFVPSEQSTIHSKECKKFLLIFLFYLISISYFVWSFVAVILIAYRTFAFSYSSVFFFNIFIGRLYCFFVVEQIFVYYFWFVIFIHGLFHLRMGKTENFIEVWLFEYSISMRVFSRE